MLLLALSVVTLLAGVLAYPLTRERLTVRAGLDGFVLPAVGGVVVLHLLPHSVHEAGWLALGVAALGFGLLWLLDHWTHRHAGHEESGAVVWGLVAALSVHAVLDGAALAMPRAGLALAAAVLVHRLPIGLVVGNLLGRRGSLGLPMLAALVIAAATVLGYAVGATALAPLGHRGLALFQALIGGTLLHVVTHHGPELFHRRERPQFVAGAVGALLGVGSVVALVTLHPFH